MLPTWYAFLSAGTHLAYCSDAFTGLVQDIFHQNIIMVSRRKVWQSPRLVPSRVYLIDFGCSLRLPLGPGIQPAVRLQDTVWERPREGATHFDPYSWDMLRVGDTFDAFLDVSYFCAIYSRCR